MEAVSSTRSLPTFNYVPIAGASHLTGTPLQGHRSEMAMLKRLLGLGPMGGLTKKIMTERTAECKKLKKAIHELVNKGQTDRFLKRNPRSFRKDLNLACKECREEKCSIEIVATIAGGYIEGITHTAWKAQMQRMQQVMTTEHGTRITFPTMIFDEQEGQNIPKAYNVILGRPTVHKVKALSAHIYCNFNIKQMTIALKNFLEIKGWPKNAIWLAYDHWRNARARKSSSGTSRRLESRTLHPLLLLRP
ncbi:hypothetical protein Cgig2_024279 [Carnegiea gigantea]|uniref:Uncharacterized protein n=1 Tax=Carnegiea gigantea TaxID=171969 RepID=A0A9Q1JFC7_9CARY|nr:hypothetical protein Cgig2_024279 [Carnegiea gigantea]